MRVTVFAMPNRGTNVERGKQMLAESGLPIISADTGGKVGRKLIFNTETGMVLLKKLAKQIDDIRY